MTSQYEYANPKKKEVSLNEITIVKLTLKSDRVRTHISKNIKIQQIVFHPNKQIIYIQVNGKWKKVSYKEIE